MGTYWSRSPAVALMSRLFRDLDLTVSRIEETRSWCFALILVVVKCDKWFSLRCCPKWASLWPLGGKSDVWPTGDLEIFWTALYATLIVWNILVPVWNGATYRAEMIPLVGLLIWCQAASKKTKQFLSSGCCSGVPPFRVDRARLTGNMFVLNHKKEASDSKNNGALL